MANLDSVLYGRDYHFADRGLYSQSYGFSVVVYRRESWTIKKAECQTDALNCGAGEDS